MLLHVEQYDKIVQLPKFGEGFWVSGYSVILATLLVRNKGLEYQNTEEKIGERKVFVLVKGYFKEMLD